MSSHSQNGYVIVLTNQKGGVGKTTTAVNLGVSLANQGKKVLLIDDKPVDVSEGILHHGEGVDLLPPNIELSGLEVRLINAIRSESVMKSCVHQVKKNYDYVLVDCMPSLGMLTINALAAAESVVIPTQPHYLSAKGLELLLRCVLKVRRQINPHLRIDGILMTMVMPRTNISKEVPALVKSAYGKQIKVFDAQIPHSIRAVEATAEGKSIFAYDKNGKVAAAYEQLGKEVAELGEKLFSVDKISQDVSDSSRQIHRYIRLIELVPEILQMVDEWQIAFRPAVELSYLSEEQQYTLFEAMEYHDAAPSLAQAIKMKKFMQEGKLTDEVIQSIMQEEKPNQKEKPVFRDKRMDRLQLVGQIL